jgi:hypothetical protein
MRDVTPDRLDGGAVPGSEVDSAKEADGERQADQEGRRRDTGAIADANDRRRSHTSNLDGKRDVPNIDRRGREA